VGQGLDHFTAEGNVIGREERNPQRTAGSTTAATRFAEFAALINAAILIWKYGRYALAALDAVPDNRNRSVIKLARRDAATREPRMAKLSVPMFRALADLVEQYHDNAHHTSLYDKTKYPQPKNGLGDVGDDARQRQRQLDVMAKLQLPVAQQLPFYVPGNMIPLNSFGMPTTDLNIGGAVGGKVATTVIGSALSSVIPVVGTLFSMFAGPSISKFFMGKNDNDRFWPNVIKINPDGSFGGWNRNWLQKKVDHWNKIRHRPVSSFVMNPRVTPEQSWRYWVSSAQNDLLGALKTWQVVTGEDVTEVSKTIIATSVTLQKRLEQAIEEIADGELTLSDDLLKYDELTQSDIYFVSSDGETLHAPNLHDGFVTYVTTDSDNALCDAASDRVAKKRAEQAAKAALKEQKKQQQLAEKARAEQQKAEAAALKAQRKQQQKEAKAQMKAAALAEAEARNASRAAEKAAKQKLKEEAKARKEAEKAATKLAKQKEKELIHAVATPTTPLQTPQETLSSSAPQAPTAPDPKLCIFPPPTALPPTPEGAVDLTREASGMVPAGGLSSIDNEPTGQLQVETPLSSETYRTQEGNVQRTERTRRRHASLRSHAEGYRRAQNFASEQAGNATTTSNAPQAPAERLVSGVSGGPATAFGGQDTYSNMYSGPDDPYYVTSEGEVQVVNAPEITPELVDMLVTAMLNRLRTLYNLSENVEQQELEPVIDISDPFNELEEGTDAPVYELYDADLCKVHNRHRCDCCADEASPSAQEYSPTIEGASTPSRGAGFFTPRNTVRQGRVYRSGLVDVEAAPLPSRIYGRTFITKLPFRVTVAPNVQPARQDVALTHEILHAYDELHKTSLSHDNIHNLAVTIMTEVIPALKALEQRRI
jgi:flagellar biosynthesis GTPase FlhF